jgi:hypothetical protein
MSSLEFDLTHAKATIKCNEVPADTLHLHYNPDGTIWFAANTKYPSTRITVCATQADIEGLYIALKTALGK